jgi:hypothetical protein
MRRIALVALATAALVTAAVAGESAKETKSTAATPETKPAAAALALGASAPMADAKMKNVDGKELSIADVKGGKGTLVVFTCNHCPWAQRWESRIVELGNRYGKQGIGVKARGYAFPYVMDVTSDVARAFGATRTPEIFLFDASGMLVYKGAVDDNAREPEKVTARYLEDALAAVLAGKKIALAETKAFGCSIKFREKKAAASSSS